MTYALSSMSAARPSYTSSRWLTSCPPEAYTRTGSAPATEAHQIEEVGEHFSTNVPPVLAVNRFQLSTLARNGNLCSRTDTVWVVPATPERS